MGLLLFVPTVRDVNGPVVSELAAGVDLTYSIKSFEPDVQSTVLELWDRFVTVEDIVGVTVEWVYSRSSPSVAQVTLTPGVGGFLAWRLGYPHEAPVDSGQLFNAVIPVQAATPHDSTSGVATKTQRLDVTGAVGLEVTVG
jgi:hypothetical protein